MQVKRSDIMRDDRVWKGFMERAFRWLGKNKKASELEAFLKIWWAR